VGGGDDKTRTTHGDIRFVLVIIVGASRYVLAVCDNCKRTAPIEFNERPASVVARLKTPIDDDVGLAGRAATVEDFSIAIVAEFVAGCRAIATHNVRRTVAGARSFVTTVDAVVANFVASGGAITADNACGTICQAGAGVATVGAVVASFVAGGGAITADNASGTIC
jgi:hypothetical protein